MKIIETFHSLQGEGKNIGLPTTFIRTGGCNLRCIWCDTKYAWENGEEMSIAEIKEKIRCHRVCITGGEPLLQEDIYELIDSLQGYQVSIETNGSIDIGKLMDKEVMVSMDHKTPSSKMTEKMRDENLKILREKDQLKFVISDKEDYEFSSNVLKKHDLECEIIFQAVDNRDLKNLADSVLKDDLDVRVLPQLHKTIWGDERGV